MHMIKEYDEHKRVNYSTAQRKVEDIKENCNKYEKKYLSLKTEYDSLKKRFTEEYKKKKTFALYAGSILTALSQILLASPLSRVIRDRLHVAAALSFIVAVAILVFVCIVLAYIYIKMRYEIPNSHSSFLLKQPANTLFYHSVIGSLLGGGLITCASFILSIYN